MPGDGSEPEEAVLESLATHYYEEGVPVGATELAAHVDAGRQAVHDALDALKTDGLVTYESGATNGYRPTERAYEQRPFDVGPRPDEDAVDPERRRDQVLAALVARDRRTDWPVDGEELAEHAGLGRQTVYDALDALKADGQVTYESGRNAGYEPTTSGRTAVDERDIGGGTVNEGAASGAGDSPTADEADGTDGGDGPPSSDDDPGLLSRIDLLGELADACREASRPVGSRWLADRFGAGRASIHTTLDALQSDGMVTYESGPSGGYKPTAEAYRSFDIGPRPSEGEASTTASEQSTASAGPDADAPAESDVSSPVPGADTRTPQESLDPPETVPVAPDLAVDYDALSEETILGEGGNAVVTRATQSTADGPVTLALKTPRADRKRTLHQETVERLLAEAETWAELDDHDHIVRVVDWGAEPLPWIAMEYMDGGDLSERAGDLPTAQALWTAESVADAVYHAHRHGVVHLDLKPANVLFREMEGAWDVPKVADWGLSKRLLDGSGGADGLSVPYAAPEQFDGGRADDRTDIYQLGAVLYELFTGRPPLEDSTLGPPEEAPPPPSDVADVPAALDDVLARALAPDRDDRYESAILLRNDLRALSAD
jgi:predicted transcriptional regulator/tRNA A-37 threonylcarbamoyl transferase component Bud32